MSIKHFIPVFSTNYYFINYICCLWVFKLIIKISATDTRTN